MCSEPTSEVLPGLHPTAAPAGDPDAARLAALRFEAQAVALGPSRVLLVDDNHHHRIPIRRALRDQGHDVLYASDGASGEAIARASQLEIDALVACADMKRMTGFELARRLRRTRPAVRVLLMSRQSPGPEVARRVHERGYAVIEEPFTPEQLCRRLAGLLAFPRNAGCTEPGLDGQDRLDPREDEVLAIASKNQS